jgi:hypothetical protein
VGAGELHAKRVQAWTGAGRSSSYFQCINGLRIGRTIYPQGLASRFEVSNLLKRQFAVTNVRRFVRPTTGVKKIVSKSNSWVSYVTETESSLETEKKTIFHIDSLHMSFLYPQIYPQVKAIRRRADQWWQAKHGCRQINGNLPDPFGLVCFKIDPLGGTHTQQSGRRM